MQNNWIEVFTFFGLLLLIGASCKEDQMTIQPVSPDCEEAYILFGHFYGECFGEGCIEIYRICENTLYEDSNDIYPSSSNDRYDGDFQTIIDNDIYTSVESLINPIPEGLFLETEKTIGQPDAGDWGGYYLEVKKENETVQFWLIDTMKDNLPAYLRDYTDKIEEAITLINN